MELKVEHVANMVFLTSEGDIIWKAWQDDEFTERKLANALKKIQKYNPNAELVK